SDGPSPGSDGPDGSRSAETDQPPRVVAIDGPKRGLAEPEPVDLPATLPGRIVKVIFERFVPRLEKSVVDGVEGGIRAHVRPEQDPLRPALEEGRGGKRLPAQLGDPGGDVDVEVRAALEDRRDTSEILCGATDVGPDERRCRVAHDDRLECIDQ